MDGPLYTYLLTKTCFSVTDECSDLPESMNGANFDSGCPGAVHLNGNPSKYYCDGNGYNGNTYPWWKQCCIWEGGKCQPKGK